MVCRCLRRSGRSRYRAAETLFECATCQGRTAYGCLGCLVCCVPVSVIELLFDIPCTFIEDCCCQGHPCVSNCMQVFYSEKEEEYEEAGPLTNAPSSEAVSKEATGLNCVTASSVMT
jgi:hypothetical protein